MKPVLFLAGHVPAYRAGAFAKLHERETIEVALFGGRSLHGGPAAQDELAFPTRVVRAQELLALPGGGRWRAVVCPTAGRLALLAGWAGTRRARLPLLLWASLWAHPRSAVHALSYLPLRRLYGSADAVVTYGPHVSSYVRARGAHNVHVAAQSVDNAFWRAPGESPVEPPALPGWPPRARSRFLFAGRDAPEKGLDVLLAAWERCGAAAAGDALMLAGEAAPGRTAAARAATDAHSPGTLEPPSDVHVTGSPAVPPGVHPLGPLAPPELRSAYAASTAVIVPSVATATFREPWGLVVNEAMNARTAVIASDAVGAAAGGLVRDGANGLIVPAGDSGALGAAIARLGADPNLAARLGAQGAEDVLAYSHEAWAEGFSEALASIGLSRGRW